MDFSWLPKYWPVLAEGAYRTLLLLVISGVIGNIFAILIGLARISKNPLINSPALAFTSVIRGTPLLVQIFILYYGLGSLFASWPAIRETFLWGFLKEGFWYIVFALVISTAAYSGEVVRAALVAVPRGEIEAARAFGMPYPLLLRRIWLPRALQSILPTLAGETVLLLKSTALASTVTVVDLLGGANIVRSQTYRVYEPLLFVAVGYLLMTLAIEWVFRRIENRTTKAYRR